MDIQLLIIDPQNDFCDLPDARCPPGEAPALPVAGFGPQATAFPAAMRGHGPRALTSTEAPALP